MSKDVILFRSASVRAGERILLHDIDLSITAGERVAIIGHNGAGKSTLLKAMTGVANPEQGEIEVLGKHLHQRLNGAEMQQLRAAIGQVFQGLHLVQRLTVLENVLLGSLARHRSWLSWARIFPPSEIDAAQAALQRVGLHGKAEQRTDQLSGGERQKVAIARMLLQSPHIILADEPTAALDPNASRDIASLLHSLATREDKTLITVVHDPSLLPMLAERVLGMRDGRIVFDLPVGAVDETALRELYCRQIAHKGETPLPFRTPLATRETL